MPFNFNDFFSSKDGTINNPQLEELLNKTRDAAETVAKKSVEGIELGRKRVELMDAKAKLVRLYERYGRLSYSAYIGEEVNPDELADAANDIAKLKDKVEYLTVEIEEAKTIFNDTVVAAARRTKEAFTQQDKAECDENVDVVEAQAQEEDAQSQE